MRGVWPPHVTVGEWMDWWGKAFYIWQEGVCGCGEGLRAVVMRFKDFLLSEPLVGVQGAHVDCDRSHQLLLVLIAA